ncbi:MAG: carbonate dehydratase [Burkholderiales bacterium]
MPKLLELLQKNRSWADRMTGCDPEFFQRLAHIQSPKYLWIGCSDSRVPAGQIVDLPPGEVFVHRNIANVVVHTDLNCLSVLQYAVDVLKIRHIIVTGHYGCGGITAAASKRKLGLIDNWLRHVQDVEQKHAALLHDIGDPTARLDRLCELNVIEQVVNVCQTTVVQDAWERGQTINVHGWIYAVQDGLLRDLEITVSDPGEISAQYEAVIKMRQNTDGGVLPPR